LGVDQGHIRHGRLAGDHDLELVVRVEDNRELRDVGRGAGRGRNADERRHRVLDAVDALEF
jgi:hypothetical protein